MVLERAAGLFWVRSESLRACAVRHGVNRSINRNGEVTVLLEAKPVRHDRGQLHHELHPLSESGRASCKASSAMDLPKMDSAQRMPDGKRLMMGR